MKKAVNGDRDAKGNLSYLEDARRKKQARTSTAKSPVFSFSQLKLWGGRTVLVVLLAAFVFQPWKYFSNREKHMHFEASAAIKINPKSFTRWLKEKHPQINTAAEIDELMNLPLDRLLKEKGLGRWDGEGYDVTTDTKEFVFDLHDRRSVPEVRRVMLDFLRRLEVPEDTTLEMFADDHIKTYKIYAGERR